MNSAQSTNTIMMVRPASFGFNIETADNNVFQNADIGLSKQEVIDAAIREFDDMVDQLKANGVNVIVIEDSMEPAKTDAIFPNNWISTHQDGSIYTYPMFSANRRLERRSSIIEALSNRYDTHLDEELLDFESREKYLEGTGSMILDREHKIIYACYSVRTDKAALKAFGDKIGYEVLGFDAVDEKGIPYYHTNVIMTIASDIVILCTESIVDINERSRVIQRIKKTGKKLVDISRDQVSQFAGNMLEVQGEGEKKLLIMSESAFSSLTNDQLHIINIHNKIVYLGLETIEKIGGGSARCMMAEIFLPEKNQG